MAIVRNGTHRQENVLNVRMDGHSVMENVQSQTKLKKSNLFQNPILENFRQQN